MIRRVGRPLRRPAAGGADTVDDGVVLEGELYLVHDDSEVLLRPGDVVVQRGTDHAWDNRSDVPARMLFVLVDASQPADSPR